MSCDASRNLQRCEPRPPRLLSGLMRRELDVMFLVMLPLCVLLSVAAVYEMQRAAVSGEALMSDSIVRRFDNTVLFLMVVLLTFRTAARVEADHVSGWLAAVFTAGASRRAYGAALVVAGFITHAAVFAGTAVTFAISAAVLTRDHDLLSALPYTLARGLLLLAAFGACTGATAIGLRRAWPTVLLVTMLAAFPMYLLGRHAVAGVPFPPWLTGISLLSPAVVLVDFPDRIMRCVPFIAVCSALTVLLSHRFAGRQP